MSKTFEFFVYGCEKHIKDFKDHLEGTELEVLDSGKLSETDVNFGKDCAFELVGEGHSDRYILLRLEVE